jgi:hypothetical protein
MLQYFRIYILVTFFISLLPKCSSLRPSDLSVSWEPWTLLQSSAIWKVGEKPSFSFQDFLEFLKATFVLNVQRLMEPVTVSRFDEPIRTVTVILNSNKFWNQILWIFFWLQEVLEQLLWIFFMKTFLLNIILENRRPYDIRSWQRLFQSK